MVDITAKLFWYRTREWCENMADKLNDVVYTDDSKETVDVINLLLLGWILLGLIVYIIGTVIATQIRKRKATFTSSELEISSDGKSSESAEHVSCASSELKSSPSEHFSELIQVDKTYAVPTCVGDEPEIVDWFNSVLSWIYKNRVISPVLDAWISALNARTRLLSTEHGILVDFKDVDVTSGPPDIREATEICTTRGDLNVICDMEIEDVNFDITVTQVKESNKTVTPMSLCVKRIFGKVNIECVPEDLSFVAKYSEVPVVELSAEPVQDAAMPVENVDALKAVVCEISSEALFSSIVDVRLSCYPECPRLTLKGTPSEDQEFESAENEVEEKLLVKIIKATNLGGNEGCAEPYCIVEMDEPPQKFETRALKEKSNPFWDESFTFTVKDVSAELLFEIYDKEKPSNANFLGLGIVSVDELIRNPSQRQIIPLQSRPLEDDNVTGALTTEFLFLNQITPINEPSHVSQKCVAEDGKTVETNSRVTAGGTVITTTTIKRTNEEHYDRSKALCNANAISFAAPVIKPVHEHSELIKYVHDHSKIKPAQEHSDKWMRKRIEPMAVSNGVLSLPSKKQNLIINGSVSSKASLLVDTAYSGLHASENFNPNIKEDSLKSGQIECLSEVACSSLHVLEKSDAETEQSFAENNFLQHATHKQKVCIDSNLEAEAETNFNGPENKPVPYTNITPSHEIIEPIILINYSNQYNDDITRATITSTVEGENNVNNIEIKRVLDNNSPTPLLENLEPFILMNDSNQFDDEKSIATPTITETGDNCNTNECKQVLDTNSPTQLHEILEPKILIIDSNQYDDDMSSVLPTITENLENSSSSSKDLENKMDVEADLTGTALKELEKHGKPNNSTSKSTLIIHSVQRVENNSSVSESLEASPASHISKDSRTSYSESVPSSPSQDRSGDDRSRSKEKKSLFGSLRRRLSFRKTRSKSAENRSESSNYSQGSSRSVSSDRLKSSKGQKPSPLKGKFIGMKFLAVPGSTRSSLSEVSGISGSSSRTYINENSTLVIETNENGIIKRYLIPNSHVHLSKWKKRGTKLHIYNDHVFVAKHLSGFTLCSVCQKYLTRRPGKQGYECRGCHLQCHKSCHVQVGNYCSNSSIHSLEVEYIHDPKGATPKSI